MLLQMRVHLLLNPFVPLIRIQHEGLVAVAVRKLIYCMRLSLLLMVSAMRYQRGAVIAGPRERRGDRQGAREGMGQAPGHHTMHAVQEA